LLRKIATRVACPVKFRWLKRVAQVARTLLAERAVQVAQALPAELAVQALPVGPVQAALVEQAELVELTRPAVLVEPARVQTLEPGPALLEQVRMMPVWVLAALARMPVVIPVIYPRLEETPSR